MMMMMMMMMRTVRVRCSRSLEGTRRGGGEDDGGDDGEEGFHYGVRLGGCCLVTAMIYWIARCRVLQEEREGNVLCLVFAEMKW